LLSSFASNFRRIILLQIQAEKLATSGVTDGPTHAERDAEPATLRLTRARGHRGQNEHYATDEVFFDGITDATAPSTVSAEGRQARTLLLAEEPAMLDGIPVRGRIDCNATYIPPLVVLGMLKEGRRC
jgi:hypothetical protein